VSVVLATQSGTLVCIQLGVDDAHHLAPIFNREHQEFNPHRLYYLRAGEAWCRGAPLYPDPTRASILIRSWSVSKADAITHDHAPLPNATSSAFSSNEI
jgi:hypothetical protein